MPDYLDSPFDGRGGPEPEHIQAARRRLREAQDEVFRLECADDFCMTNGSWSAAQRVVRACQDDLVAALTAQVVGACREAAS